MRLTDLKKLHIDIDVFLNRYVPHPHWHRYPAPVAHFLGHRLQPQEQLGNVLSLFWSFIGVFCGLLIVTAISIHIPAFQDREVPMVVGSFGAAAVLAYCAIESPLAQPRNAVLGHLLAAVAGVAVSKLFGLHPHPESIYWIAGPMACALATLVMGLTKTVHPPAGATALLAAVDPTTRHLGWFLLPVVLLSCVLILVSALVFNNIQRRFPLHWWTPDDLLKKIREDLESSSDEVIQNNTQQLRGDEMDEKTSMQGEECITIKTGHIYIPPSISLTPNEIELLESLSKRI
ncbi:hypothetical protein FQN57_001686 [Myotisia sp. PD_48]|nr:hypothetical protein FQN57_001686 [Myotisia sp. PD_48]